MPVRTAHTIISHAEARVLARTTIFRGRREEEGGLHTVRRILVKDSLVSAL